jgi:hypothetical protein
MGEEKQARRPHARRKTAAGEAIDARLLERLSQLESRVAGLEQALKIAPPAPPKHEAAAADKPRCPGCRLPVDSVSHGRCPWCGFLFEAMRARRLLG